MIRRTSILLLFTLVAGSCATTGDDPNARAKRGAGVGAAAGAIVGAIIGNQTGNPTTGAVIGAAAGAAIGGAVGHDMDKQARELREIPNIEVSRPSPTEISVELTSDILFDVNSSDLRPESRTVLGDLAENFRRYPSERFEVEGHTDSTGSEEHNQKLSQRRADSVRYFLMDGGVPGQQIFARGYGEMRPKASNETPEGRQMNRRVEIHITAAE